jgi:hypothetical protein
MVTGFVSVRQIYCRSDKILNSFLGYNGHFSRIESGIETCDDAKTVPLRFHDCLSILVIATTTLKDYKLISKGFSGRNAYPCTLPLFG